MVHNNRLDVLETSIVYIGSYNIDFWKETEEADLDFLLSGLKLSSHSISEELNSFHFIYLLVPKYLLTCTYLIYVNIIRKFYAVKQTELHELM